MPDEGLGRVVDRVLRPLARGGSAAASALRARLQEAAQELLGPVRTAAELERLLALLAEVERDELPQLGAASPEPVYDKSWLEALEVENTVTVLTLSARAALERSESRGVHYREDAPATDSDRWLRQVMLRREGGEVAVRMRPLTMTSITPQAGSMPYLDHLKLKMQSHSDTGGAH